MTMRARGPLAGFRWLKDAINLGRTNPRAVFGGAALVALMSMVPSLITLPMQFAMTPGPGMLAAVMGVSMLCGLLLAPMFAGYMRIIDAADRGHAARAVDVFMPYRSGEAPRLVGYGLAMLAVYVLIGALLVAVAGRELVDWYLQAISVQNGADQTTAVTALPDGFGRAFALGMVCALLITGVYAISLGQVALGGRSVLDSVRDGLVGSLKNLLPLLVLAVSGIVAMIVLVLVFGVVAAGLALLAQFVGAWLMFALMLPLYCALMLAMFVVMFGVMYHLWRDVSGNEPSGVAPAQAIVA